MAADKWCPFSRVPVGTGVINRVVAADGSTTYPAGTDCLRRQCMLFVPAGQTGTVGECGLQAVVPQLTGVVIQPS